MTKKEHTSQSLLPVSTLLSQAWERLAANIVYFFFWMLISISIFVVTAIIIAIPLIVAGFAFFNPFKNSNLLDSMNWTVFGSIGVLLLAAIIVVLVIVGTVLNAGTVLIAANEKKSLSYKQLLRKGWSLVLPLFIVSVISSAITTGAFFLLIIPGIILSILISYATYEVILHDVHDMEAIKNSFRIVLNKFWGIVGRVLLIIIIGLAINVAPVLIKTNSSVDSIITFLGYVAQIIFGWYSLCYTVLLYQNARSITNLKKPQSLRLAWIVSVLGWVFFIVVIVFITRFLVTGGLNSILDQIQQQSNPQQERMIGDTSSGQILASQQAFQEIQQISTSDEYTEPEKNERIVIINEKNIADVKNSLLKDPENTQLWQILCISYSLPNTSATEEDKNTACERGPIELPQEVTPQE